MNNYTDHNSSQTGFRITTTQTNPIDALKTGARTLADSFVNGVNECASPIIRKDLINRKKNDDYSYGMGSYGQFDKQKWEVYAKAGLLVAAIAGIIYLVTPLLKKH